MKTNFFQQIASLNLNGDLQMTITQPRQNWLVVAVHLSTGGCGDEAGKLIAPINLKGTPEEFDQSFFASLSAPLQTTSQLFSNMEAYLKQQEQAQQASKMEKDKAVKADKEKSDKDKKYDEALKKVAELENEGKYREAWMKVPDPGDYPDRADSLRQKREELSAHFAPSLF